MRALLRQQVDVNAREADGTTALHWAVRGDAVDIALSLIRAGAAADSTNRYGVTPLILAATNGNAVVIEALMKAGADPNDAMPEGQTVLMAAARTGKVDAVKALLRGGADPNVHERRLGETALMWAAAENHAEAVDRACRAWRRRECHLQSGRFSPFQLRRRHRRADDDAAAGPLDAVDVRGTPGRRGCRSRARRRAGPISNLDRS